MKTLTICGSMRFEKEMCSIAYDLETKYGYAVFQCVYAPKDSIISPKELENLRHAQTVITKLNSFPKIWGYYNTAIIICQIISYYEA